GHGEAVRLPRYRKRAAAEASDDRHLGAASRQEQLREARILEQRQGLLDDRLALLGGKLGGRAVKVAPRGLGARRARNVGQRLQQPVHDRATRQGLVAIDAAAVGGRAHRRRLVIGERRRDEPNRRRFGARIAVEPGRAFIRGRRWRGGGEGFAGRRRRLAIAPDLAVAVVGGLLDRDRRLERRKHQVP